jgi:hypothetical protein
MATAHTDGTKLAIQMALVVNGCGLPVAVAGMPGPVAKGVHRILDLFALGQVIHSGRPVGGQEGAIGLEDVRLDPTRADVDFQFRAREAG